MYFTILFLGIAYVSYHTWCEATEFAVWPGRLHMASQAGA